MEELAHACKTETVGEETRREKKRLLIRDRFDPSDYVLTDWDVRATKNGNGLRLVLSFPDNDKPEPHGTDLQKELMRRQVEALVKDGERRAKAKNAVLDFSRKHKDLVWESSSFEEYEIKHDVSGIDELKLVLPDIPNAFETVRQYCEPETKNGVIYCPYVPIQRADPITFGAPLSATGVKTAYGTLESGFDLSAYFQRNALINIGTGLSCT